MRTTNLHGDRAALVRTRREPRAGVPVARPADRRPRSRRCLGPMSNAASTSSVRRRRTRISAWRRGRRFVPTTRERGSRPRRRGRAAILERGPDPRHRRLWRRWPSSRPYLRESYDARVLVIGRAAATERTTPSDPFVLYRQADVCNRASLDAAVDAAEAAFGASAVRGVPSGRPIGRSPADRRNSRHDLGACSNPRRSGVADAVGTDTQAHGPRGRACHLLVGERLARRRGRRSLLGGQRVCRCAYRSTSDERAAALLERGLEHVGRHRHEPRLCAARGHARQGLRRPQTRSRAGRARRRPPASARLGVDRARSQQPAAVAVLGQGGRRVADTGSDDGESKDRATDR